MKELKTTVDNAVRLHTDSRNRNELGAVSLSFSMKIMNEEDIKMPQNKRESLIYTVLMCFTMVLWMSMYNVSLHMGEVSLQVLKEGWIGFPVAYILAMLFDWFLVSKAAKTFAFRFLVKKEDAGIKKVIAISCCMVVPMVILMSFYGGIEVCLKTGTWNQLPMIWLLNIPINFMMALPFQLIVAGPLVRKVFRTVFPEGKILA